MNTSTKCQMDFKNFTVSLLITPTKFITTYHDLHFWLAR